jgi:hypothetical protein
MTVAPPQLMKQSADSESAPAMGASALMIVEINFAADSDAFTDAPIRAQLVRPINADPQSSVTHRRDVTDLSSSRVATAVASTVRRQPRPHRTSTTATRIEEAMLRKPTPRNPFLSSVQSLTHARCVHIYG